MFLIWIFSFFCWALPDLEPNQKYDYTNQTWLHVLQKEYPFVPCFSSSLASLLPQRSLEKPFPVAEKEKKFSVEEHSNSKYICGTFFLQWKEMADDGGQFAIIANIFSSGYYQLIGDEHLWPFNVKINDKNIVISEYQHVPYIYLESGIHSIEGSFSWNEIPSTISIPKHYYIQYSEFDKKQVHSKYGIRSSENYSYVSEEGIGDSAILNTIHVIQNSHPYVTTTIVGLSKYSGKIDITVPKEEMLHIKSIFPYSFVEESDKYRISFDNVYGNHSIEIQQVVVEIENHIQNISITLEKQPPRIKNEHWLVFEQKRIDSSLLLKGEDSLVNQRPPSYITSYLEKSSTDENIRFSQQGIRTFVQVATLRDVEIISVPNNDTKSKTNTSTSKIQRVLWWNPLKEQWIFRDFIQLHTDKERLSTTELNIQEIRTATKILPITEFFSDDDNTEHEQGLEIRNLNSEFIITGTTRDTTIPNSGYNITFDHTELIRFVPQDHKVISVHAMDDWRILQLILCIMVAILTPKINRLERIFLGLVLGISIYTQAPWILCFVVASLLARIKDDWCHFFKILVIWIGLFTYAFCEMNNLQPNIPIKSSQNNQSQFIDFDETPSIDPYQLLENNDVPSSIGNDIPQWEQQRFFHRVHSNQMQMYEIFLPPTIWIPIFIFHLCLLLYLSYRFYGLEIPNFIQKKQMAVLCLFGIALPKDGLADTLMGYELQQITENYLQQQCQSTCTTTSFMRFDISAKNKMLQITAEVHVDKKSVWQLPGPEEQWMPQNILVDGIPSTHKKIFRYERENQGHYYFLLLEPGVWEITIEGFIENATFFQLFENIKTIDFQSEDWEIEGITASIQTPNTILIYPKQQVPPSLQWNEQIHLRREIYTHPHLHIKNILSRIGSNAQQEQTILVPSYLDTHDISMKEVIIAENSTSTTWIDEKKSTSEKDFESFHRLNLSTDSEFHETWILHCSLQHHCSILQESPNIQSNRLETSQIWYPKKGQSIELEIRNLSTKGKYWSIREIYTSINTEHFNDPYLRWNTTMQIYSSIDQRISFELTKKTDCHVQNESQDGTSYLKGSKLFMDIDAGIHSISLSCIHPKESLFWYSLPFIKTEVETHNHRFSISSDSWIPFSISSSNMWGDQKYLIAYILILLCLSIFCAKLQFSNLSFVEWFAILTLALIYHPKNPFIILILFLLWNLISISSSNTYVRRILIILWYILPFVALFSILWMGIQLPEFYIPFSSTYLTEKISFVSFPFRSRIIPITIILVLVINWMVQRKNYPLQKKEI